jgi:hypothetical protein
MNALPVREAVIASLWELSDDEVVKVLEFIKTVRTQQFAIEQPDDDNPAVGFFSAEPDFAARSQEVLRKEFGRAKPQDSDPA